MRPPSLGGATSTRRRLRADAIMANLPKTTLQRAHEIWEVLGDRWDTYLDFVYDFIEMSPDERILLYTEASQNL